MDWTGRKILVTGGAGFLGSNLCHALAERGARVTALDGFLFGGGANPANLEGAEVELVRGDIREIDLRPLCEGAVGDLQPRRADQPHGRPERPAGRHRGERGGAGAADPGGARGGAGCGGGARLDAAVLRPGRRSCRWTRTSRCAARRQRRVEVRRRAVLDARAPRARPAGGVVAADQLLRPAPAHPRCAADLPGHLDSAACWRASRSRSGAASNCAT